ncbi:MAG: queuosine precursor transporter [Gammaproteobacteria bacterium]|nr:queuosine precursor transporter [Gammaproteobacteria bacterium]
MNARINKKLVRRLVLFHIAVIALANYAVQFTASVGGYDFTWGMFVFPLAILATDLTVRLSTQQNARVIVAVAYVPALVISALLAGWRIGIASGCAYLAGQLLDISVFQKIRERAKSWWMAPLVSTFFANIIDTYVFFAAAFYRSEDAFMAANWPEVAAVDLAFKTIVSVLLFLPAYRVVLGFLQARIARASA